MTNRFAIVLIGGLVVVGAAAGLFVALRSTPAAPTPPPAAESRRADTPPPAPGSAATPAPTTRTPAPVAPPKAAAPAATPAAEAAPTTGTLVIESDVPETSVFIDRVYLGNAPVTVPNLTPGPHRLNMSVTGYDGISETIDVTPGTRTISIKFKDIKLDEHIAAIHKHAMGSCAGTLRASPQGLTYETTNKSDAFTVALTDLDAFEVDYLQKNLKVKVRKGKTYNFSDADGNVDRLYLFHQTVDKVRQRLIGGRRP